MSRQNPQPWTLALPESQTAIISASDSTLSTPRITIPLEVQRLKISGYKELHRDALRQALDSRPDIQALGISSDNYFSLKELLGGNKTITKIIVDGCYTKEQYDELFSSISGTGVIELDLGSIGGKYNTKEFIDRITSCRNLVKVRYTCLNSADEILYIPHLLFLPQTLYLIPQDRSDHSQTNKWEVFTNEYSVLKGIDYKSVSSVLLSMIRDLQAAGVSPGAINDTFNGMAQENSKIMLIPKCVHAIMKSLETCDSDRALSLLIEYLRYNPADTRTNTECCKLFINERLFDHAWQILSIPKLSVDFSQLWGTLRMHVTERLHEARCTKDGFEEVTLEVKREPTIEEMNQCIAALLKDKQPTLPPNFTFSDGALSLKAPPSEDRLLVVEQYRKLAVIILKGLDLENHPEFLKNSFTYIFNFPTHQEPLEIEPKGAAEAEDASLGGGAKAVASDTKEHLQIANCPPINLELAFAIKEAIKGKTLSAKFMLALQEVCQSRDFQPDESVKAVIDSIILEQPNPTLEVYPQLAMMNLLMKIGAEKAREMIDGYVGHHDKSAEYYDHTGHMSMSLNGEHPESSS